MSQTSVQLDSWFVIDVDLSAFEGKQQQTNIALSDTLIQRVDKRVNSLSMPNVIGAIFWQGLYVMSWRHNNLPISGRLHDSPFQSYPSSNILFHSSPSRFVNTVSIIKLLFDYCHCIYIQLIMEITHQ
ncbi:hypothetical protein ECA2514 [Pectobacterium atrosepticum SCRI1043]|uniref:Uncharacterized protein n=1 Tax=Pectobacterium atrosepticum (strain SCRI 1043 / ATCC BAA-672) TaxID=218491 RepID=Q6D480_PECAS|nr:hypothetical protein ECA2514 [Pectobacterium atrosepticum SCRI1043]